MSRSVSPRLEGHPIARGAVSGLRFIGRTALGERLAGHWYRRTSRAVASELARLPSVESVYLSGSTRERVHLGYSDIDLVVATRLTSVTEELRLRDALGRCLGGHNRPIELFPHVDYVEATDLAFLRRLGNAWSTTLDRRSELLAGRDDRRPGERPRPLHAAVVSFVASL